VGLRGRDDAVVKWLSSVARENYFNARDPDLDALAIARPVRSTAVHVRAYLCPHCECFPN